MFPVELLNLLKSNISTISRSKVRKNKIPVAFPLFYSSDFSASRDVCREAEPFSIFVVRRRLIFARRFVLPPIFLTFALAGFRFGVKAATNSAGKRKEKTSSC